MAKYRITAPDGGTYEITAPDDASESDVLSYAQQQFASSSAPTHSDFSGVQGGTSTAKMIGPGGWLNERGTLMYPDGATIDQVNQINQSY